MRVISMQIPWTGALSKMDAPSRHLHSVPAAAEQLSARKHQLTDTTIVAPLLLFTLTYSASFHLTPVFFFYVSR